MIQIAIVDDHPVARRGFESILTEAEDITVTCSVGSDADLPAADSSGRALPDVVLLDLYLGNEEPCLPVISELSAMTKVLVISAFGRAADVLGAILAGASGYVTKQADDELLVSAVRTVASGGFALSSQLADILRAELGRGRGAAIEASGPTTAAGTGILSAREEQTLDLIARGFTPSQVARRMGVNNATIDTYVGRIRARLQVENKAEFPRSAPRRIAVGEDQ